MHGMPTRAQAAAVASVEDDAHFRNSCAKVVATREALVTHLHALGFEVLPSAANFIFARHAVRSGAELAKALRERSIIVRHFSKPRIENFLRISVGTAGDLERLVQVLTTHFEVAA